MNILHVHENDEIKGGSEVYIRDLCAYQNSISGQLAKWFAINKTDNEYEFRYVDELSRSSLPVDLSSALDVFFEKNIFDIVHIHGISDKNVIAYFIEKFKVVRSMHEPRMVCPGHGKFWINSNTPCTISFGIHCLFHAYAQKCFQSRLPNKVIESYLNTKFELNIATKKYEKIIVMSDYVKNEASLCGVEEEKIRMIPYFTSFDLSYRKPVEKSDFEILFVGRLIAHKGIHFLVDAMIPILREDNKVRLRIIGDGPESDEVKLKSKGIDNVVLHPWANSQEISTYMMQADLIVFPSIYPEAFGIVGIEAFAHSKPVIAFNVGGISTWLRQGINGILLNEISSESLSEAILNLKNNFEKLERLGKNAWNDYNRNYRVEKHGEALSELYAECL